MKCPFCAEEIQDEAVLCRFCGAQLHDGQWRAPETRGAVARTPGYLTLRISGALFILSAVFGLFSVTSPVPLFGEVRGGSVAIAYNLSFVVLFGTVGIAIWRALPWGLKAVLAGTALYTLDRALYVLDETARHAELASGTELLRLLSVNVDVALIDRTVILVNTTVVLCWWGFAAYVWWRRGYFQS